MSYPLLEHPLYVVLVECETQNTVLERPLFPLGHHLTIEPKAPHIYALKHRCMEMAVLFLDNGFRHKGQTIWCHDFSPWVR